MTYVPCPEIDTYQSANAIPARRWCAMFRDYSNSHMPKHKNRPKHLPMNFWAASEAGAIAAASAFWADGQEKIARQRELVEERAERMRQKPKVAVSPEGAAP